MPKPQRTKVINIRKTIVKRRKTIVKLYTQINVIRRTIRRLNIKVTKKRTPVIVNKIKKLRVKVTNIVKKIRKIRVFIKHQVTNIRHIKKTHTTVYNKPQRTVIKKNVTIIRKNITIVRKLVKTVRILRIKVIRLIKKIRVVSVEKRVRITKIIRRIQRKIRSIKTQIIVHRAIISHSRKVVAHVQATKFKKLKPRFSCPCMNPALLTQTQTCMTKTCGSSSGCMIRRTNCQRMYRVLSRPNYTCMKPKAAKKHYNKIFKPLVAQYHKINKMTRKITKITKRIRVLRTKVINTPKKP